VIELIDGEILVANVVSDDVVVDVTFVVRTEFVEVKLVHDELGIAVIDVVVTEVVDNVPDVETEEEEEED